METDSDCKFFSKTFTKGVRVNPTLHHSLFDQYLDAPLSESSASIRLYGAGDVASHHAESNVVKRGHINVHTHHVCRGGSPLGIRHSMMFGLEVLVVHPDDVEPINPVPCRSNCQRGPVDIVVRIC